MHNLVGVQPDTRWNSHKTLSLRTHAFQLMSKVWPVSSAPTNFTNFTSGASPMSAMSAAPLGQRESAPA